MRPPLTIACAHPDGTLPSEWFRAYKRLKRNVRRTGLNARVALVPESDVPPDAAIVVSLRDGPVEQAFRDADKQLQRLIDEGRVEYGAAPRGAAVHRGFRPLTERALLEDD
ncbi:MAG TPA: hypothetical protein VG410_12205 [Solirubrobacteraceae bacterium]|jgi:hypothetical protein|nr:hypothetical protein [Solirubrobacteraceae bacterium]